VALNFVVVGGGPTGVETAGALSELIDIAIKRDGLRLDASQVRILLVDLAPRLLTAFPESASRYAKKTLEKMGVDVACGRSVVEVEEHAIRFADGERLETTAVIWAGGITARGTLSDELVGPRGPGGRALVGADLRLVDSANVWSIGDTAAIPDAHDAFYPQTRARRDSIGRPLRGADSARAERPGHHGFSLPRPGHHGHDRAKSRRGEVGTRGRHSRQRRMVGVAGAAPVVSRGLSKSSCA